jgi:hypothetical protein
MIIQDNFKLKNIKKIDDYLNTLTYEPHSSLKGAVSTFQTDISKEDNFPYKLFKPLFDKFLSLLDYQYDIIDFWVNRYSYGGFVAHHNHRPKPELKSFKSVSGIYYFRKPPHSGNLILNDKLYPIKENDLLIFSPYNFHSSEKNLSQTERIVFSLNLTKGLSKIWNPSTETYLYLPKKKGNNVYKRIF